jgi:hypothetical protein
VSRVTLDRINAVRGVVPASVDECRTVVAAVLRDVPDVEPFAFAGYPDNPVFLHPCGTVTDAKEGTDLWDQVQAGECYCENTQPWHRIYVEKSA